MTPEDRRFLGLAIELARRGLGSTSPNPAVGAVLVRDGTVVGEGYHERAGGDHAETIALRAAGESARGADLYTNLEPCSRHRLLRGKTPPCVEQIIDAGVRRVVAAARDPNPLNDGRGLLRLEQAGVLVEPEDAAFARRSARLNEIFFKFITSGVPFVTLKAAMTLDGKIGLPSGASKWITGDAAREDGRSLRAMFDAVLVGIGTVLADDPLLLPLRGGGSGPAPPGIGSGPRGGRSPLRVVLDSRLRLPTDSRLARTARQDPVIVYASEDIHEDRQRALEDLGVVIVSGPGHRVSIPFVLNDLARREATSVLVEGGGETLGAFLRGGFADKVRLYIAPRLMGGRNSIQAFGGEAPESLEDARELEEPQIREVGGCLVVEGYLPGRSPGFGRSRKPEGR